MITQSRNWSACHGMSLRGAQSAAMYATHWGWMMSGGARGVIRRLRSGAGERYGCSWRRDAYGDGMPENGQKQSMAVWLPFQWNTKMLNESKIDITDRLRNEGRWADASAFKDECQQALRAQGVPRQEANRRAWAEMRDAFPPLAAEQISWMQAHEYAAMAEFPPSADGIDADGEPPMDAVWWLWGHLLARLCRYVAEDFEGASAVSCRMITSSNKPSAVDCLGPVALHDPFGFLRNIVAAKFNAAAGRIANGGVRLDIAAELQVAAELIGRISSTDLREIPELNR